MRSVLMIIFGFGYRVVNKNLDKLNNTDYVKCDGHFNTYFKMQKTRCVSLQRSFEDSSRHHYSRENPKPCNDQLGKLKTKKKKQKNWRFSENYAKPHSVLKVGDNLVY